MLFSDGTFKTVPHAFAQLFSIHGRYMNFVFPMVYALTTRMTEDTYSRVYEVLKTKSSELGVTVGKPDTSFMMDFELANMNAVKAIFPRVKVKGCLFHFDQSIWRKVLELGLKTEYETVGSDIRQDVVTLMALPFIPLDDLQETFNEVTEEMVKRLDDVVSHLDVHYVKGVARRNRRIAPRFAPEIWNTYGAALAGDQRTNNAVEGWHNHLQLMMVIRHASIWRFLENLKREENEVFTQITQVRGGHTKIKEPVNKKYLTNQRQVEQIVRNYQVYKDAEDAQTYLRAIGYHLKAGGPPPPPASTRRARRTRRKASRSSRRKVREFLSRHLATIELFDRQFFHNCRSGWLRLADSGQRAEMELPCFFSIFFFQFNKLDNTGKYGHFKSWTRYYQGIRS